MRPDRHSLVIFLLLAVNRVFSAATDSVDNIDLKAFNPRLENILTYVLFKFWGTSHDRVQARYNAARKLKKFQTVFDNGPFPCTNASKYRSPVKPTSVHRLMPGDIDVIAAMGDSLSVSFGGAATRLNEAFVPNRGLSWSMGGDGSWRTILTLPNILREFNPALIGFSTGDNPPNALSGGFNVAEGGAVASDMLYMAKVLTERIKADKRVNFEQDWKVVTIMIGSVDVCTVMCYLHEPASIVSSTKLDLMISLDYLRDNLPRTFVNLVPISKIDRMILKMKNLPLLCQFMQRIVCSCVKGPKFERNPQFYSRIIRELQKVTSIVASDPRYDNLETFAVVEQPWTEDVEFAQILNRELGQNVTDLTFLAPDCFHLSQSGLAKSANALWNNMMEPVGKKSTAWEDIILSRFECPTGENPFIYTNVNSRNQSKYTTKSGR